MRMRFWQKTYILTLVLFLVCLNAGIFSLARYTYGKNVSAAEALCESEQFYVERAFERDYDDLAASGGGSSSPSLLMRSYGIYYAKQQTFLAFSEDGTVVYSSFSESVSSPAAGKLAHKSIGGKRHILIAKEICGGRYSLVYGKNVSSLDDEYRSLMITYVVTALGVSLFLAVCLYFVLKKLSEPLERLKSTTERIASGDYGALADESGSDEFSLLAMSFNAMVGQINTQIKALELNAEQKQQLVDNLAHELRTPLTTIHGYAEYLQRAALTEEEKIDAAEYIMAESERLQSVSEKLLDTAYIGRNGIKPERVAPGAILSDVAARLKSKADDRGVSLTIDDDGSETDGDAVLLNMLFYNLADNAIKACDEGGAVRLCCERSGDAAAVTVSDNGKGMTAEQLAHITEPFYRTDKSRSRAEGGTGLGLALCRRIAEAHGAKLSFKSEEGKGTEARVSFTGSL